MHFIPPLTIEKDYIYQRRTISYAILWKESLPMSIRLSKQWILVETKAKNRIAECNIQNISRNKRHNLNGERLAVIVFSRIGTILQLLFKKRYQPQKMYCCKHLLRRWNVTNDKRFPLMLLVVRNERSYSLVKLFYLEPHICIQQISYAFKKSQISSYFVLLRGKVTKSVIFWIVLYEKNEIYQAVQQRTSIFL